MQCARARLVHAASFLKCTPSWQAGPGSQGGAAGFENQLWASSPPFLPGRCRGSSPRPRPDKGRCRMERTSQCVKILEALLAGEEITALDALRRWGCFRLAARIKDLRDKGIPVSSEWGVYNGKRVKVYYLRPYWRKVLLAKKKAKETLQRV